MFSIITIASSTTKPLAMVSDIRERLSREKPNRYIPASVPTSDRGTERLGMMVAGRLRRKTKITSDDEYDGEAEVELDIRDGGANRVGLVGEDGKIDAGRKRLPAASAAPP